jgi:hypothetical protein
MRDNNTVKNKFKVDTPVPESVVPPIMDMRGVAQFDDEIIIAGGMEAGQQVSNKVYRVNL